MTQLCDFVIQDRRQSSTVSDGRNNMEYKRRRRRLAGLQTAQIYSSVSTSCLGWNDETRHHLSCLDLAQISNRVANTNDFTASFSSGLYGIRNDTKQSTDACLVNFNPSLPAPASRNHNPPSHGTARTVCCDPDSVGSLFIFDLCKARNNHPPRLPVAFGNMNQAPH